MINTKADIVCFSLARWDSKISSPALCLAKEFARSNRVFFIDHPFSYKDFFLERSSEEIGRRRPFVSSINKYYRPPLFPENFIAVSTPLTLPINILPAGKLYDQLALTNHQKMIKLLRRLIDDFKVEEYIFINFFDPFFLNDIPSDIRPSLSVYHCMDDISQVPYTARHGLRLEEEIIRKFDLVLCTSSELLRLKSMVNNNTALLPNAADFELFSPTLSVNFQLPQPMTSIPSPIVGFTGSIEYRTDFLLLKEAIEYHQNKSFVFIGPVTASVDDINLIRNYSNVYFIEAQPIEDLPPFLFHFDCAIIPYKRNTLTRSIYPLKINEYLAAGKPVVATAFSDDVRSFSDVAFIASDAAEFIKLIDIAISTDTEEKFSVRRKRASENTWQARVKEFWRLASKA